MKTTPPSPDSVHAQAVDWLLRIRSENCPETERHAFNSWLEESAGHRQAYETVQAQWEWMEPFRAMNFPARDAALRYRGKSPRRLFIYSAAATLLLAMGLTAFMPNGWLGIPYTYVAEKGEHQTIKLADGSSIELNTECEVRVHFNRWQRSVDMIKGEAFFTVAHDAERPFEVRAGSGRIRDIGTAFEVYIKPEHVIVAVQEGIVEVQASGKRELTAGQQLAFSNSGEFQALQAQDVAGLTAWRQGNLVFRNRRLDDVLAEVGRYHDTRIRLQNEALGKLRVSGTFHTAKLGDTLNAIAAILPVSIDQVGTHEIVLKSATSNDR
ncbi:FecR family protein [Methylobacter sp.]|uniref:FecR family protein n=1 Tax=Methylobacter sp. TaxID=2051955 RepID=UPI002486EA46|nr:FecR family protein [Methylobacter sp.]MDI1276542.1 FecR family protein [Methylobacter sp.]MDI1357230.1 FecR family protein [Methylobacter sp.]